VGPICIENANHAHLPTHAAAEWCLLPIRAERLCNEEHAGFL
jgi:hypothetical protein